VGGGIAGGQDRAVVARGACRIWGAGGGGARTRRATNRRKRIVREIGYEACCASHIYNYTLHFILIFIFMFYFLNFHKTHNRYKNE